MNALSKTICCECCDTTLFKTLSRTSGLSILNIFMGFFFKGVVAAVAVLAGASTNLCNEADFLGNGELLVNSGVREEYTDLSVLEPRVALFDFSEDVRAVGAVDDDDEVFGGVFGGAFGRLGIIVFP